MADVNQDLLPLAAAPAPSDLVTGVFGGVSKNIPVAQLLGGLLNKQTGTSYTLALTDASGIVEMSNTAANNVIVPPDASVNFPLGTQLAVSQFNSGSTSIVAGAGVTVHGAGTIGGQYKQGFLYKHGVNEWVFSASGAVGTPGIPTLNAPVMSSPTVVGSTELDTSWTDTNTSPNEASFELQRSPDNLTWTTIATPAANATSYNNTALTTLTLYYYRIRAVGDGTTANTSAWSNVVSQTTGSSGAVDLAFTTPTNSSYSWTKTTDANGDIYVASGAGTGITHTQKSPKSLPSTVTGRIWAKYAATDAASNAQLYFKDVATVNEGTADYGTSKWEMDFHQSGNLYFSRLGTFTLLEALVVGTYYGIYRDGSTGTIKIQKSTDAVTWTDVSGGTFSDTSTAQLYPFIDLDGTFPGKMYYPKGLGVV